MTQAIAPPADGPSFVARVGTVLWSIVRNVPTRGVLWGFIGLVVGFICIAASLALGVAVLGRGAALLEYLLPIAVAIPTLGAGVLAMHGLHRGAARAALDLERRFGLCRYVVDHIMRWLEPRIGGGLSNLPLGAFQRELEGAVEQYLGSDDMLEGSGLAGWVIRRAKRAIGRRAGAFLLAAYRAEERPDGSGGGVSLEKIGARAAAELSERLGETVMSPLNKQLVIILVPYVIVGVGWWAILGFALSLAGRAAG